MSYSLMVEHWLCGSCSKMRVQVLLRLNMLQLIWTEFNITTFLLSCFVCYYTYMFCFFYIEVLCNRVNLYVSKSTEFADFKKCCHGKLIYLLNSCSINNFLFRFFIVFIASLIEIVGYIIAYNKIILQALQLVFVLLSSVYLVIFWSLRFKASSIIVLYLYNTLSFSNILLWLSTIAMLLLTSPFTDVFSFFLPTAATYVATLFSSWDRIIFVLIMVSLLLTNLFKDRLSYTAIVRICCIYLVIRLSFIQHVYRFDPVNFFLISLLLLVIFLCCPIVVAIV